MVISQRCRDEVPEGLRERIAQALKHEHLHPDMGGPGGIPKL
jgi:hypothetical protein